MESKRASRVAEHTPPEVTERIQQQIRDNVRMHTCACPELIDHRLGELDREWSLDRAVEAHMATAAVASTILGLTWKRGFLCIPLLVGGFLMQHAVSGWCPPLMLWRRLGLRTREEIEQERQALKALRGDYQNLEQAQECHRSEDVEPYLAAAQR